MKKRLLSLLLACVFLCGLSACGGEQKVPASVIPENTGETESSETKNTQAEVSKVELFAKNARDIPEELEVISAMVVGAMKRPSLAPTNSRPN